MERAAFPSAGKGFGDGAEGIGFSIDELTNLKTIVFNLGPASLGKKEQLAAACRISILPKPPEPENDE